MHQVKNVAACEFRMCVQRYYKAARVRCASLAPFMVSIGRDGVAAVEFAAEHDRRLRLLDALDQADVIQ